MKTMIRMMVVVAGLVAGHGLMAQAPAGAPAGATGMCKDGTYWTGASKQGACRGHQGVKDWYAAADATGAKTAAPATTAAPPVAAKPAPAPAPAAAAAPTPKPAPTPAKPANTASSTTPAPGGGPGMVWVNTDSNVYHCSGTKYYGTTKQGKYMTEAAAKAAGARPDHGNACSK